MSSSVLGWISKWKFAIIIHHNTVRIIFQLWILLNYKISVCSVNVMLMQTLWWLRNTDDYHLHGSNPHVNSIIRFIKITIFFLSFMSKQFCPTNIFLMVQKILSSMYWWYKQLECPDLKFSGPDKLGRKEYFEHLRNSKFCLAPRGESSWTLRFYESFFVVFFLSLPMCIFMCISKSRWAFTWAAITIFHLTGMCSSYIIRSNRIAIPECHRL